MVIFQHRDHVDFGMQTTTNETDKQKNKLFHKGLVPLVTTKSYRIVHAVTDSKLVLITAEGGVEALFFKCIKLFVVLLIFCTASSIATELSLLKTLENAKE